MKCPISLFEVICANFRPFSDMDWESFAGVRGDNPHIADVKEYQVVLDYDIEDGTGIGVYDAKGNWWFWWPENDHFERG